MNSDGPKSARKRREIRAKHLKKLTSEEDESGKLVKDNNKGPKRGREGQSDDDDKPLIKKAAFTKPVESQPAKTSDSYLSKTRYILCFNCKLSYLSTFVNSLCINCFNDGTIYLPLSGLSLHLRRFLRSLN